jgi:hypothetical protein
MNLDPRTRSKDAQEASPLWRLSGGTFPQQSARIMLGVLSNPHTLKSKNPQDKYLPRKASCSWTDEKICTLIFWLHIMLS